MYDPQKIVRFFLWGLGALGLISELTENDSEANERTGKEMDINERINMVRKSEEIAKIYSEKFGVPLPLIMSIIRVESNFNNKAVNKGERDIARGGAWGLMQMTFQTALDLNKAVEEHAKEYWPKFDPGLPETLLDITTNIAMGTFFLSQLLKLFDNDIYKAGTAYNQGGGTIKLKIDKAKENKRNPEDWYKELTPNGQRYYQNLKKFVPTFSKPISVA